jgi:hypothetical protein
LAAWGLATSAPLRALGALVTYLQSGFASTARFDEHAQPVHSLGSLSLPRPLFTQTIVCGAGISYLLAIAYDYNVLGLGPDSP